MIAKISVGKSLYDALAYNQNKVDQEKGKVLFTNKISENYNGMFDIYKCIECFNKYIPEGIRTKKNIIHISLNPHPDDKLSDEQLSEIAQEYMKKLGYINQPFMVFKHEDINRHHVHIVSVRTNEYGKKINDSFEHVRSKKITDELEKKYNLHPAEKQNCSEYPELKKVNYRDGDVKHQISNTVKALISSYYFESFTEYKALLSLYNIHVEEIKGEATGKPYHGIIYSATNDKEEKKGNPIKASRISRSVSYNAISRKIATSTKRIKEKKLKEHTRQAVSEAFNGSRTRKQFEKELRKKGINVIFRQNSSKRIYGVTFIDHDSRVVLNGSRLGKEYSANAFNERFNKSIPNDSRTIHPSLSPGIDFGNGTFISNSITGQETFGNDIYSVDQRKRRRKRRKKNL